MIVAHLALPDLAWYWFDLRLVPEGADATWLYMEKKYGIQAALDEFGGVVTVEPRDWAEFKASVDALGGTLTQLGEWSLTQ